jgi:aryl-alcohol dehydrogenase-like predicted oxidoreductase
MRYNRVGGSGLQVSAVGLGNWNTFGVKVHEADAFQILFAARDAGINLLDTADTYGNGAGETILGNFLQQIDRDQMVVATKLFFPISPDPNDRGLSRKHIYVSVNRSLRRLRTDYIDLLQCHRFDDHTPLDETIRAMDDLIRQGKILYWGVSRFNETQIARCCDLAAAMGAPTPVSNQFAYNLLERGIEASTLPGCASLGVGMLAYSPLAQGVLTGKYLNGECPADSRGAHSLARKDMWQHLPTNEPIVARLNALAARHGLDSASLAIAWCLRLPGMSAALTGATAPEQVRLNARAADLELGPALLGEIEAILQSPHACHASVAKSPVVVDVATHRRTVSCN